MSTFNFQMDRRGVLKWAASAAAVGVSGAQAQSTWPAKPVTLIVPFPAGGPTDVFARQFAQRLGTVLGQSVVVENVAGASGMVRERVQVTVIAGTYPSQKAVLALVRAALPRSRGTVNGCAVDSILPDVEGPDFSDPDAGLYIGSLDYVVTYTE